jgi:hypothetical protein
MSNNVIHIVVDEITPRVEFVFDFMFNQVFQTQYVLHLPGQQNIPNVSVLYYSKAINNQGLSILAHPLLFASGNEIFNFKTVKYQSFPYPFATANESLLPFDPFAVAFYFLSQYEEQTEDFPTDQHQRFDVKKSKIFPYIHFPMVDVICKLLKIKLEENGFCLNTYSDRYEFIPTFDIDIAFAHRAKTMKRHILGTAKLVLNLKHKELIDRLKVWIKLKEDPYDVFEILLQLFDEYDCNALFFALVAENGKYNNNNLWSSTLYQNLLKNLNSKQTVSLHSSYDCMSNNSLINHEKSVLETIIGNSVHSNRQHFLRFRLPEYWNMLINSNITNDYSQGFYNTWGYRCGTSFSHKAFDVSKNEILPITIHPFIFMDTALIKEFEDDVVMVHEKMIDIISECKSQGVPCIGVWHNYAMPSESLYLENFIDVLKFAHL